MAQLIGTAGHVDHGKTTLIKALTGVDTDRLPEEKKRGLTIDIGFAAIDLPGIGKVSIVDVPGHEKFIGNMLVGALGMDVVMLCIAADQGVMPQTIEHFEVIKLLPVERLIVVLTRCDLADEDSIELVGLQVEEMLSGTRFEGSEIVSVSALSGAGLDKLTGCLRVILGEKRVAKSGKWYLPVDRVFSRPGHGTVVTGTLARGILRTGDSCAVLPENEKTRAKSLQVHGEQVGEVFAGQRVAINLAGVDLDEVFRGYVVCEAGACFATELFDAEIHWVERPKHGARVRVSVGADEVIAKAFLNDDDEVLVQLRSERVCVVAKDQPLIVRSYSPARVLGGGKVLVPEAKKRRKNAAVSMGSGLLDVIGRAPTGVMADEIARLMGSSVQALGDEIEQYKNRGEIIGFAGLWFTAAGFEAASEKFFVALGQLHQERPERALIPRDAAVKQAGLSWAGKPLDRMVSYWVGAGKVRAEGVNVALAAHRPELKDRQRALLDRVKQALDEGGVSAPGEFEITNSLGVPKQAVAEIMRIGVEAGELVRVAEGIFYTEGALAKFVEEVREVYAGQRFTAAEFKEKFGTSRKYAIPLLEWFDSVGVTMRQGDARVVR